MQCRKRVDVEDVAASIQPGRSFVGVGRAWVIALVLLAVCGRVVFLLLPANSDTAMFVYAGKLVAEGERPGVDLLDNKLPSVGLLMSIPFRMFGSHWIGYGVLGLLLSLIASWFLYRVARDLWGRPAGTVVALASAVWLNFPPAVYGQLQLETIQIALASIAGACALRVLRTDNWRDALTAGLCGGLAMWAKPTGGAVLLAAGVTMLVIPRRRRLMLSLLAMLLGAAVPTLICILTMHVAGLFDALPETFRQLRDYSSQSTLNGMDAAKPMIVIAFLGFPVLVLTWIFRRDEKSANALPADRAFVLLWLTVELIGVVVQRRMYAYHFLVLGPPAALATGMLARRVTAASLTMAMGPAVALTTLLVVGSVIDRPGLTRDDRVIAYVKSHTAAVDAVWIDDYPRMLVETDRRPGSSVPLIFLMANSDAAPDFFGRQILKDWSLRQPACIAFAKDPAQVANLYRHHMADVASSPARADAIESQLIALQVYLELHYRPEIDIDGVRLWRRNDPAARDSIAAGD